MCQEKWENVYLTVKNARAYRALRRAVDPSQYVWTHFAHITACHRHISPKNILAPPSARAGSATVDLFKAVLVIYFKHRLG